MPSRTAEILAAQRPRSVSEDEVQFGVNPIDELRRTVNTRGYNPEQAAENRYRTMIEALSVIPGPGNVISAQDAYTNAGDAYNAFGGGDYKGGALAAALAGLSGAGAIFGLPVGRFAKSAATSGKDSLYTIPTWYGRRQDPSEFATNLRLGDGQEITSPFPYIDPFDFSPSRSSEAKQLFSGGGHVEMDIPLANLVGTQSVINRGTVAKYQGSPSGELPKIVKYKGEYIITDGHHRLAADLAAGKDLSRVRFVDMDAIDGSGSAPAATGILQNNPYEGSNLNSTDYMNKKMPKLVRPSWGSDDFLERSLEEGRRNSERLKSVKGPLIPGSKY